MKKVIVVLALASVFGSSAAFADVSASATASWDATATKDTTSALVVTPLNSLAFQYADGIGGFNTQDGAFDVTIQGQSGATDFDLTALIVSNTLVRSDNNKSTLSVGTSWNGEKLSNDSAVTLISTKKSLSSGLEALVNNNVYANSERVNDQSTFKFNIDSATDSTGAVVTDYSKLDDGYWSGDVKVQFTATWAVDASQSPSKSEKSV